MLKRTLYLSVSLVVGVGVGSAAQAELKINPYPQGVSAVKSDMSNAEPIDLIKAQEAAAEFDAPLDYAPPPPASDIAVDMSESGVATSGAYRSKEDYLLRNGYKIPAMPPVEELSVPAPTPIEEVVEPAYASTKAWARPSFDEPRRYTAATIAPAQEREIFEELDALSPAAAADVDVYLAPVAPMQVASAPPAAPVYADVPPLMERPPKWMSFAGANVRETLDVWSRDAGVELIWANRDSAFDVRKTINVEGTYEEAVQSLLEQYDDSRLRPVGSLHVNSQTGVRTLVIEITQGG